MISIIATEYPRATPVGPWLSPRRTPTITTGVVAAVMPTARPTRPVAIINQESGFANAKTKDVGASNWKIGTTSIHLSPSSTWIISSGKKRTRNCDRNGCRQEQRIAPEKGSRKASGVILDRGEARDGNDAEGRRELFDRQRGELKCPAVKPKRVGAPEAAQEDVLGVPRQVHEKTVTGRKPPEPKYRPDADSASRRPRRPRNRQQHAGGR